MSDNTIEVTTKKAAAFNKDFSMKYELDDYDNYQALLDKIMDDMNVVVDDSDPELIIKDWELQALDNLDEDSVSNFITVSEIKPALLELTKLDDEDQAMFVAWLNMTANTFDDFKEEFETALSSFMGRFDNDRAYAENEVWEGLLGEISDQLKIYLDYERIASDIMIDTTEQDEHYFNG